MYKRGTKAFRRTLEDRSQGYGRLKLRSSVLEGAMNEMSAQERNQPGKLNIQPHPTFPVQISSCLYHLDGRSSLSLASALFRRLEN